MGELTGGPKRRLWANPFREEPTAVKTIHANRPARGRSTEAGAGPFWLGTLEGSSRCGPTRSPAPGSEFDPSPKAIGGARPVG